MQILGVVSNDNWRNREHPLRCALDGCERLGHHVEVCLATQAGYEGVRGTSFDAALIWNGVHGHRLDVAERLRMRGIPTLIFERGWFDRFRHTQIDHAGFNHNASWAKRLHEPAPAGGAERLARLWPHVGRMQPRQTGYVLLLLQVPADSQLIASPIQHPVQLIRAVQDAVPAGIDIRARAHPLSKYDCGDRLRTKMLPGTLGRAVAGARFAVTINSGAANEAIAWGCPVLCLGPALYAMGNVAYRTHLEEMAAGIGWMLDGVEIAQASVDNYLHWLAARQWSLDELRDGRPLEGLIRVAAA